MTTIDCEPSITVGMPIKDRVSCIAKVLEGIENLDYPKSKCKLVFVDAFSLDGTYEYIVNWKDKFKGHFYDILLIQEETNIPQARNICIENAHSEYVLFWDSDVVPPKKLLRQMLSIMRSNKKIGIVGADYIYEHKDFSTNILFQPLIDKEARYAVMGFTLIRREIFNQIGVFNESIIVQDKNNYTKIFTYASEPLQNHENKGVNGLTYLRRGPISFVQYYNRGEDEELILRLTEKTDYKTMWAPQPVLHLKKPVTFRQLFTGWLREAFHKKGVAYAKTFSSLPLYLRLRPLYYFFLPVVVMLASLVGFYTGFGWAIVLIVVYLLSGILVAIRSSSIRRGTILFFVYNIPVSTAIAYGALLYSLKSFFRRLTNRLNI